MKRMATVLSYPILLLLVLLAPWLAGLEEKASAWRD